MDQVIKESLRLYPPIHAGNRLANEDMQIGGCPVPEGSRILFSFYLTQRDEGIWQDAQQFCPDRFERSKSNAQPALSYLPFGAGPRNCIGAIFAQVEAKAVLARIIQSFDIEPVPGRVAVHMGATLEPRPGVLLKVTRKQLPSSKLESTSRHG
jgi:cytochrome P450